MGPLADCRWEVSGRAYRAQEDLQDHAMAASWVLDLIRSPRSGPKRGDSVPVVGHRVVHGGERYTGAIRVTDEVLSEIELLNHLAPLHNPPSVAVMRVCRRELGSAAPMAAVFDTAFFAKLPASARGYALPADWRQAHGIRRYGFHGIAHRYLYERFLEIAGAGSRTSRVITLQLGHGCSATALHEGTPLETSMGFTPLEGLIMATRPGDVDPGALLHLARTAGLTFETLDDGLNRRSGLLGLSGTSADMRELLELEAGGHAGARLAVEAFCHRVRKYLGAYMAVLGGVDAVLFGGGIGENSPVIRDRICRDMEWCGIRLQREQNAASLGTEARIDSGELPCRVYVIPVDEEWLIAQETLRCLT